MRQNFPESVKKAARKRAAGQCEGCGQPTGPHNPAEVHHNEEDWAGGKPVLENAVVLGAKCCHKRITAEGTTRRAKADAQRQSYLGEKPSPQNPMPGSRRSKWKRKIDGTVVLRLSRIKRSRAQVH